MNEEDLEDYKIFGEKQWVYCSQHLRPHLTGWCSVHVSNKLGLGIFGEENSAEAYQKCRNLGLKIYRE